VHGVSTTTGATRSVSDVADALVSIQDDIRRYFGWQVEADRASAELLVAAVSRLPFEIDQTATLASMRRRLAEHDGEVAVIGAAAEPSRVRRAVASGTLLIVADGALGALLEATAAESTAALSATVAFVSDGDGGDEAIRAAIAAGLPFVLHAHADNIDDWSAVIDRLTTAHSVTASAASSPSAGVTGSNGEPVPGSEPMQSSGPTTNSGPAPDRESRLSPPGPLVITHQTPSDIPGAFNPGGFTDGDRAACLALSLDVDAARLRLIGHRTDMVGRWSGSTDPVRKLQKLRWMAEVFRIIGLQMDGATPTDGEDVRAPE